jgi:ribosomal protein S18 acetylase RimI-like enzyme
MTRRDDTHGPARDSITIRAATASDWPDIWRFMSGIVAAGETFSWDPGIKEGVARARWMHDPPGRTFVAVDAVGAVVGSAESEPNHEGPGAHIATASFMVDPAWHGRGIGRALCAHTLDTARADGFRGMQFNAVAQTNTVAVALWQSLGFEILATIPEGFHHPTAGYVGLHVMYQPLAGAAGVSSGVMRRSPR